MRGSAPGRRSPGRTAAARASSPMRRAATAGNSASRSVVTVKMQLTIRSATSVVAGDDLVHQLARSSRGCPRPRCLDVDGAAQREQSHPARHSAMRPERLAGGAAVLEPGALVPADPQGGCPQERCLPRGRAASGVGCASDAGWNCGRAGGLRLVIVSGGLPCTHLLGRSNTRPEDSVRIFRRERPLRNRSISAAESRRDAPGCRSPSASGPKRVRRRATTRWPTASHMRLTWRLRPSWIVSSSVSGAHPAHLRRRGHPVLELDPFAQRCAAPARAPAGATLTAVGLGHLEARVGEPVGQLAVVGEQDQARWRRHRGGRPGTAAPGVGTSDDHRRTPLRVPRRGDDTGRLVERRRRRAPRRRATGAPSTATARGLVHVARRIGTTSPPTVTRPSAHEPLGAAARGDAGVGEVLGQAHGAATISPWTSRYSTRRSPRAASPPSGPARCGRGRPAGAGGYERDDRPPRRAARRAGRARAVLDADARARGPRRRRDGQGALLDRRRPPGRGGADALPRRPALGVRVLAVGLPADLHLLRDGRDALRPQPQRVGDPRPGPALPPPRARSTTSCSWAWASR